MGLGITSARPLGRGLLGRDQRDLPADGDHLGTFFTPKDYPEFLRVIAEVLPLTHYTALTRDVMVHGEHIWSHLGAVAVVARLGRDRPRRRAIRGFRWQPVEG